MWNAIITLGASVVFAVVIYIWGCWTDREREQFANGNARWLE